ncbi:MAG: TetR/AcrR family transcriptional regulator [bacterium]
MSPTTNRRIATSPSRLPAAERRERILAACAGVFAEHGFAGTRTRDLAEACGVSEAILYRHFRGKEALFEAVLEREIGRFDIPAFLADLAPVAEDEAVFRAIALRMLEIGTENPTVHRLLVATTLSSSPRVRGLYVTWRRPFVDFLGERVRRGIERGEMRAVDPTLTARAFVGLVMDCVLSCHLWSTIGFAQPTSQALVDNNVPTFVRGLRADPEG